MRDSVFYESQALLCRKLKKKPPQGSSAGPEGYQQRKTNIILSNGFQKWPKIAKNVKETLFQMANHYWTKSFELNIKRKWKLYLYFLFAPLRLLCHFFLFLLENAWTIWSFQSHYCKYVTSTTDQQELSIWPKCLGFWEVVAFLHLSQVFFPLIHNTFGQETARSPFFALSLTKTNLSQQSSFFFFTASGLMLPRVQTAKQGNESISHGFIQPCSH